MQNKLINFKEWDWALIHAWLLKDQVLELELQIMKSNNKSECVQLRKRLALVREAIEKNKIEFSL